MRTITVLDTGWTFVKTASGPLEAAQASGEAVTLPHTWNADDGQDGGNDYYRGTCWYIRELDRPAVEEGGEAWLEFAGAAMTAEVYLNGEKLARHEGGYSAFRVNLTGRLREKNTLAVSVDNSDNDRVYPQKADFTFYGGLYREVRLICVPQAHFDLSYCGAPGIKVTPVVDLESRSARVIVETWQTGGGDVTITVAGQSRTAAPADGHAQAVFTIENVRLWDGVADPYLYTAAASLPSGDQVSVRFGCRKFEIDPQKGFLLNGRSYPLRGVSRHQDRKGAGNALTMEMHREDMAIVREIGANPQYQSAAPERGDYTESYQALYHEHILKMIEERPWLWATHVWNLFDFAADGRDEGGKHGENQKGLVTFDRKLKKDAFYLYKAAWNKTEPFVHLCGSRYVDRTELVTEIKVYSNQSEVSLYVDGRLLASQEGRTVFRFRVPITGEHSIEARSGDVCSIMLVRKVTEPNPEYIFNREASAVTNWFDQEIDSGCYSIADTLAELRSNPEAGAIIDRMMAQASASRGDVAESVKDNPALQRMMGRMTLISLLKQAGNIDEESIKQLNRILQGIRKTN